MENASSVARTNSREGDQANYFYVVWPEETVTTISATGALDPTLASSQLHLSAATHRHPPSQNQDRRDQQVLQQEHHQQMMEHSGVALSPPAARLSEIEVGGFTSPLTSPILSIADASPLVAQSSAAVQTSPQEVERNKIAAIYANRKQLETNERSNKSNVHHEGGSGHSQSSYESSGTSQPNSPKLPILAHSSQSTSPVLQNGGGKGGGVDTRGQGNCNGSSETGSVSLADHEYGTRRKRSRMQYYNINGCLECEVKDAEIRTLRRRIQVMEEVVALLNQKLSAIQQSSNGMLFSPMVMPPVVSQVVIPSSYTAPPTTSVKQPHVHPSSVNQESNHSITGTPPRAPSDNEDASSDSASIAYAQSELCPPAEHRVELIAGSGVYVTLPRLEEARREAKNGTQLARKLMDAFWDRETLARSSLSSKSKYQYQQLDPNVISTIEAYCLSFDSTTHSRDLHACMTDKCCQARSRRGAPYKNAAALHGSLQQNGVVQNGFHNGIDGT